MKGDSIIDLSRFSKFHFSVTTGLIFSINTQSIYFVIVQDNSNGKIRCVCRFMVLMIRIFQNEAWVLIYQKKQLLFFFCVATSILSFAVVSMDETLNGEVVFFKKNDFVPCGESVIVGKSQRADLSSGVFLLLQLLILHNRCFDFLIQGHNVKLFFSSVDSSVYTF